MPKTESVAVTMSVTEWKVLSAILDEVAMALPSRASDEGLVDILRITGFEADDVPAIQELVKLGSGDPEHLCDGTVVDDFLVVAGVHRKIKQQAGLEE